MVKGLEPLSYKERPRPGVVQPGAEKVQGDLTSVHKYLVGGCKEDRLLGGAD